MLSSVARAPAEGRTNVVNTLENRQAGQGRRVANTLSEGFERRRRLKPNEGLHKPWDEAADAEFGAVREDATPVDLTNAIARIDETLTAQHLVALANRRAVVNQSGIHEILSAVRFLR
jgi:hypothetical protein